MLKPIAAAAFACATILGAGVAEARRDYPVTLTYAAPAAVVQGVPTITLTSVRDNRDHPIDELGSIRDLYGSPQKVLITREPVAVVVTQAIRDALGARSLGAEDGAHRMLVRIVRFDCNQMFPKEAHIELAVRVEDAVTNALLYEDTFRADQAGASHGPGAALGGFMFTPIEPLRALTNQVMNEGIDRMLDDPAFRAALASAVAAPAAESPLAADVAEPQPPVPPQ